MIQTKPVQADCNPKNPDSEAARLLGLCAEQIVVALAEASADIDRLSESVLDASRHASTMLSDNANAALGTFEPTVKFATCGDALQRELLGASANLQFADRLQQRLMNVATNLTGLAKLLESTDRPITDSKWLACLSMMRANFTMEQERAMFDAVFELPSSKNDASRDRSSTHEPVLFDAEAKNEGE